ncbi:hypothetical protein GIB67_002304 [Kingdonia uniflora]|uniref:Uncharacterized protein n=1 Tax=Kingdonia uniflora TaxID=39325 RepID=A0A7J7KX17_9MAGN|nr:hypothetical protein GIB67_002304 [Kingdonia uniflora]
MDVQEPDSTEGFSHILTSRVTCTRTGFNRRIRPYSNISGDVQLHKPPGSAAYLIEPCYLAAS